MPKKKKTKQSAPDYLRLIADYIESSGWKVMVIGPARIHQEVGASEFNFDLVIGFTGVKKNNGSHRSQKDK